MPRGGGAVGPRHREVTLELPTCRPLGTHAHCSRLRRKQPYCHRKGVKAGCWRGPGAREGSPGGGHRMFWGLPRGGPKGWCPGARSKRREGEGSQEGAEVLQSRGVGFHRSWEGAWRTFQDRGALACCSPPSKEGPQLWRWTWMWRGGGWASESEAKV